MRDDQTRQVGEFFNHFAAQFDSLYGGKRSSLLRWLDSKFRRDISIRFEKTFEIMAQEGLDGASVLDIGCGSGIYSTRAAQMGAKRVLGIDLSREMISLAEAHAQQTDVRGQCMFITGAFPEDCPSEQFRFAIVMGVMDYVSDPGRFLAGVAQRITHRAIFSFPSKHWLRTPLRKYRYLLLRRCQLYFYDEQSITVLMSRAGFREIAIEKIPGAGMDYLVQGTP